MLMFPVVGWLVGCCRCCLHQIQWRQKGAEEKPKNKLLDPSIVWYRSQQFDADQMR